MRQSATERCGFRRVSYACCSLRGVNGPEKAGFSVQTLSRLGIIAVDFNIEGVPGFSGWLHEEWHRAVMHHRGVTSYNEIMDWPHTKVDGGGISVSHEADEDLTRMKRESNPDFVRLQSAGWESQWEQNRRLRKEAFFLETQTWNTAVLWANLIGVSGYLNSCVSGSSDKMVTDNYATSSKIAGRDFTGPDCTGWTYDLHRQDEPYSARGIHPSGVGISRYRKKSDLSGAELDFLRSQANLAYLNYLDPMLLGFNSFAGVNPLTGEDFRWNLNMQHTFTSFGGDTALGAFYAQGNLPVSVLLHVYKNKATLFPGIEIEVPKSDFENSDWVLSPKTMIWAQPAELRFDTKKMELGGLLSLNVGYRVDSSLVPYSEILVKSRGWVAGVVDQERSWAINFGLKGIL